MKDGRLLASFLLSLCSLDLATHCRHSFCWARHEAVHTTNREPPGGCFRPSCRLCHELYFRAISWAVVPLVAPLLSARLGSGWGLCTRIRCAPVLPNADDFVSTWGGCVYLEAYGTVRGGATFITRTLKSRMREIIVTKALSHVVDTIVGEIVNLFTQFVVHSSCLCNATVSDHNLTIQQVTIRSCI